MWNTLKQRARNFLALFFISGLWVFSSGRSGGIRGLEFDVERLSDLENFLLGYCNAISDVEGDFVKGRRQPRQTGLALSEVSVWIEEIRSLSGGGRVKVWLRSRSERDPRGVVFEVREVENCFL